ncbi:hypothetical protein BT93_J1910 [Corymbia citriodora subsp. variegata]|nr:hypothetical protein BT93_J1910 [Corymbia citriodora subsp. variegata]
MAANFVIPTEMKAWVYREHGDVASVLRLDPEFEVPKVQESQVLVKVLAAALNPVDTMRENAAVPGYDLAGIVVKAARNVKKLKVGEEVRGFTLHASNGTLAEYTAVEESLLALKPKKLSFEEAASQPAVIQIAYGGLEKAGLSPGKSLLVLGGASGVGTLAIQLGNEVFGASRVAATSSTGKLDLLKSLGAELAIDYTKVNFEDLQKRQSEQAVKAIKLGGSVVTIGEHGKTKPPPAFSFVATSDGSTLAKPVIDPKGPFPFSQAIEAFSHLQSCWAAGKVVIHPIP